MVIRYTNFGGGGDDWDDDPAYTPPPRRTPPPSPRIAAPATPAQKSAGPSSSFVSIEVDHGLLPTRLQFASNWQYQVSAHEVGRELLKAYQGGVARQKARLSEAAGGVLPLIYPHAHFLSDRQRTIMLLETDTWDRYIELSDELFGFGNYRVQGPATMNDEPVMTISGDREMIRSIRVWSQWWGCADSYALEAEILACADKIRAMQPKFQARRDWSRHSDEDLVEMKRQHRRELLELLGRGY
ncbi:hypothetical protein VMT65_12150 [Nocardia sp. CDC153]|uniref:hypothetical protein n=1 Tax=Nocardia sp. CDC153 TaxID=3112167 RepID=UPI002DBE50FD|nr:hypothetical protein [Nocardia sp. CDC153]MEC3953782.1 hypothetical protein [Nocardia sp. CDC153]